MACARGCCPTPRDHYLSIGISAEALPNKGGPIIAAERRQDRWDADMPAYKALREQGIQPAQIDGASELSAKAETRFEIESGKVIDRRVRTAMEHHLERDIA